MAQVNMKDLVKANDFGSKAYQVLDLLTPVVGDGAPAVNAKFLGQTYVDETTPAIYKAKAVGSVAAADDWVRTDA